MYRERNIYCTLTIRVFVIDVNYIFIADVENNYTLSLYNSLGQKINATQKHLAKGQNTASINLSNVTIGFCILEVQNNITHQKVVQKLIKQFLFQPN